MGVTEIQTNVQSVFANAAPHKCYVRERWSDPWVLQKYLYCHWVRWCAAPDVSEARLAYEYGQVLRPDDTQFREFPPLEILGWFVKIEIEQPPSDQGATSEAAVWIGRLHESPTDRRGAYTDAINGRPVESETGVQEFRALGLEADLMRAYVTKSIIEDGDGGEKTIG